MMIYYHILYDIDELYGYPIPYDIGINKFIGQLSAVMFILISGISSYLSKSNTRRGLKVFGAALIISVISHAYNMNEGIKFGILHFLGISMFLSPVFTKLNVYIVMLTGLAVIGAGNFLLRIRANSDLMFFLGIRSEQFTSADYYPMLPWFGLFLFGVAAGKLLYTNKVSKLNINLNENIITRCGRNTLLIYLVHQPLILMAIEIFIFIKMKII